MCDKRMSLSYFLCIWFYLTTKPTQMKCGENKKKTNEHHISFFLIFWNINLVFVRLRLVSSIFDVSWWCLREWISIWWHREEEKSHLNKSQIWFVHSLMCRIFITSDLILVNDLGCSLFSKEKMVNLLDFKEAQREEKKPSKIIAL